jgi:uncharacterized protein (TIRG00374 family)
VTRTHDEPVSPAVSGTSASDGAAGEVTVVEPPRPHRIRRRGDLLRLLATLGTLILVLLLPAILQHTTSGIQSDIAKGTAATPHFLLSLASLVSTFGVLAVPVAFAADRLVHRDALRVTVGLLAAVIALGVTVGLDTWVHNVAPQSLAEYLAWTSKSGVAKDPLHTDLTPVIAYVTAVRLAGRFRWQFVTWTVISLSALAALASGYASPLALAVTYLIGRAIGYATLYAVGTPNPRPPGSAVVTALQRMGLVPVSARRVADGAEETRRYEVGLAGPPGILDVTVLDRDQQIAGLPYRLWRRLRVRGASPRRAVRSLRRSLEQESLMAYALTAADVRTPRLLATSEVGTEAALLAYEHVTGRPLDSLADEELTDELLTEIWRQLRLLQSNRLAHRGLEGGSVLVDDSGRAYIVDARAGEIAAGDLVLKLDLAQLLTTVALRVGPERTVRTASAVLGADALGGAVPFLQKVALSKDTRTALRRSKDLLTRIRDEIVDLRPESQLPPAQLERIRPRTLISVIAGTFAAYVLLSSIGNVDVAQLAAQADWRWAVLGLAAAALSYLAAAWMLLGYVPEKISLPRTVLVQLAGSFIKLVAPAAVTGVAVNTRFLQKSGVRPTQAVASVGASQLTGFGIHLLMLTLFGFISGSSRGMTTASFEPSRVVVIGLLAVAVLGVALAATGPVRRFVMSRVKGLFDGVVPRLLDVLQSPRKLVTGLGGTLLLTASFVVCLDASIRAFGGSLTWTTVAVVFLTGNAVGSAVPTPGGLGAVEASLIAGLTFAGLPSATATSAVLLYRVLTFWLPVLPGWAAFTWLQRQEAI